MRRLAGLATEAGVETHEHSRVDSLDDLDSSYVVIATSGYSQGVARAGTEHPTHARPGDRDGAARPAALSMPSPRAARPRLPAAAARRPTRVGGRRDAALETENTAVKQTTDEIQAAIAELVRELVGRRPQITHRWAGIFGTTADLLPLVGPVPWHDGVWVAAGYSGRET